MYILPKSTVKRRYVRNVYGPIGQVQNYMLVLTKCPPTFPVSRLVSPLYMFGTSLYIPVLRVDLCLHTRQHFLYVYILMQYAGAYSLRLSYVLLCLPCFKLWLGGLSCPYFQLPLSSCTIVVLRSAKSVST